MKTKKVNISFNLRKKSPLDNRQPLKLHPHWDPLENILHASTRLMGNLAGKLLYFLFHPCNTDVKITTFNDSTFLISMQFPALKL